MSQNRYVCQTPQDFCTGGKVATSQGLNRKVSMKAHSTPEEAFSCYARHLEDSGHEKLGPREFRLPEGGILILTKKSRYGAKLRKNKNELHGKGGKRYFPAIRGGGIIKG